MLLSVTLTALLYVSPVSNATRIPHASIFLQCTIPTNGEKRLLNWSINFESERAFRTEWNYTADKWTLPDGPFDVVVSDTAITLHQMGQLWDETVRISRREGTLQSEVKSNPGSNSKETFAGTCKSPKLNFPL